MSRYNPDLFDRAVPRRGALLGGASVAVAALLAGCTSSKDDDDRSDPTAGSASSKPGSTPAPDAFPVTVPGKEGAATVKSPPQRVVAAGYLRDTDLALAFGAPLVGAASNSVFTSGLAPWQKGAHPKLFKAADGMPYETVAALRPDLILASDDYALAKEYQTLAKIAPTLSYDKAVGADTWQSMTTRAARVLGKPAAATPLINAVEAKISAARQQNSALAGKTFTFGPVSSLDSIYTINSPADASAHFFGQLGMALSPTVTSLPDASIPRRSQLSLEQLDLLDADVLIISYPSAAARSALEAHPLFTKLPAVRRGSYVALDTTTAVAVAFPSVLSIPYGLQMVLPKLVAAAKKAA